MPSISQANSTNDMIISKEQKGATSAPRWVDLVDEAEQIISPPTSKLNPQAPAFVPSCKAMQILTRDRALLDALKSPNLSATKVKLANRDILHTLVSHDMDTLNTLDNNKKILATTFKPSGIVGKRHELGALVLGPSPTEAFGGDMGINIFDEEEENDVLNECFANVAWDGANLKFIFISFKHNEHFQCIIY
ncbi:hypothetical protein A4A49_11523 [Nicotiana attenuata]|uniref:Uncharacterized protein n=1 Tax=Nicotiana attenuata TaxID=49451 RepID=A0A1J6JNA1_NICAT|nr:hypothetical protein A4A49_11523 [Nicotiana attenuata]